MSTRIGLRCRCGEVFGVVSNPSPQSANRVTCYCDDCQAFMHQLGRADLLDAHGGTDIVQIAPSSLSFVQGQDKIAGVRLTPKRSARSTSVTRSPTRSAPVVISLRTMS